MRKTFGSPAVAKRWLNSMRKERDGSPVWAPARITLNDAAAKWLGLAEAGAVRNRSDPYKPSAIRNYREA